MAPPLIPGNAEVSGADGSQIISGLLTALPLCSKNSTLYISEPKSIPYMFITEDILRKFGVRVKSEMEGDERMLEEQDWSGCTQICFSIKGGQSYKAATLELEGDWSAAANFLVAGAIFGKAEVVGLNTDSLQADLAIADILVQAGAVVSEVDNNVCVSKAPLEGFEADLANAPDLFPICSVLAAFCDGETTLHGVDRLHGKESDRAAAILEMMEGRRGVPRGRERHVHQRRDLDLAPAEWPAASRLRDLPHSRRPQDCDGAQDRLDGSRLSAGDGRHRVRGKVLPGVLGTV